MSTTFEDTRNSRRRFLKGVVAAGGAVGAGLVAGTGVAEASPEGETAKATEALPSQGYHVTSHITHYYEKARC
jgi:hypothetical protein